MKKFIRIIFGFLILALIIICMILSFSSSRNNETSGQNTSGQNHCFRAAVYEHIRQGNPSNNKQAIHFNLKVYENVAQIAAKK